MTITKQIIAEASYTYHVQMIDGSIEIVRGVSTARDAGRAAKARTGKQPYAYRNHMGDWLRLS